MKILSISNLYPSKHFPNRGIFVKVLIDYLQSEGHVSIPIHLKKSGNTIIHLLIDYTIFYLKHYKLAFKTYDLIYVNYVNHSSLVLSVFKACIKVPLVLNAHGGDIIPVNQLNIYLLKISSRIFHKAALFVVPSNFLKSKLNDFEVPSHKVFVYPSGGIDATQFSYCVDHLIKPYSDTLNLIYVGRIEEGKGWDIFLEVLIGLKKVDLKFTAKIVGDGKDVPLLRRHLKVYGLEEMVTYFGSLNHREIHNLYSKSDLLIYCTKRQESLGLVPLEAMASGLPVIASNYGAIPEYIIHRYNGFCITPNVDNIIKQILQFSSFTKTQQRQLSLRAYKTSFLYDRTYCLQSLENKLTNIVLQHQL